MNSRVGLPVDVDGLVVDWLTARLRDTRVGTQPPLDLAAAGQFVWVAAVGGPSDGDTALPRVDLQCFAPGRPGAAWPLAGAAHQAMDALGGQTVGGQVVHSVTCSSVPVRQFWSDSVDRYRATYELDLPVLG